MTRVREFNSLFRQPWRVFTKKRGKIMEMLFWLCRCSIILIAVYARKMFFPFYCWCFLLLQMFSDPFIKIEWKYYRARRCVSGEKKTLQNGTGNYFLLDKNVCDDRWRIFEMPLKYFWSAAEVFIQMVHLRRWRFKIMSTSVIIIIVDNYYTAIFVPTCRYNESLTMITQQISVKILLLKLNS